MEKTGLFLLSELAEEAHPPIGLTYGADARSRIENLSLERVEAKCFACRRDMTKGDPKADSHVTKEDVFPKWLVKKWSLGRAGVDLLWGPWQGYPGILVPCCRICNNVYMSAVENRVSRAVQSYDKFRRLKPAELALWSAKVAYGLLHFEVKPWDFKRNKWLPQSKMTADVLEDFASTNG